MTQLEKEYWVENHSTGRRILHRDETPEVGSVVTGDDWDEKYGAMLVACDDWEKADFRLKTVYGNRPIDGVAVNIKVTGRTIQKPSGKGSYHVRIEFRCPQEDGTEKRFGGWMLSSIYSKQGES